MKTDVHFLLSWHTECAAVRQLHDGDGEALVSRFIAEAELHLRAAQRQPLLVGAQEEVGREARPGRDIKILIPDKLRLYYRTRRVVLSSNLSQTTK